MGLGEVAIATLPSVIFPKLMFSDGLGGGKIWRYNIFLPSKYDRDLLVDKIFTNGLYASTHYMSVARIFKQQICINAERESSQIINLFNEEKYSEKMAFETVNIIKDFIKLSAVNNPM